MEGDHTVSIQGLGTFNYEKALKEFQENIKKHRLGSTVDEVWIDELASDLAADIVSKRKGLNIFKELGD